MGFGCLLYMWNIFGALYAMLRSWIVKVGKRDISELIWNRVSDCVAYSGDKMGDVKEEVNQ